MNDTATKTEPTVRVEWGERLEWADGHVEYSRRDTRDSAEFGVTTVNRKTREHGKTARVVTRTVTTTPWAAV